MKTLSKTSKRLSKGFIWIAQLSLIIFVFSCDNNDTDTPEASPEFDYLNISENAVITEEEAVVYGNNNSFNLVDILEASDNDDNARPLILLSPGGGFKKFNRIDELENLGRNLASRGYVVGIVKYRINPDLDYSDQGAMQEIWLDGVIDQRTAVRYFKTNASSYRIDPAKIFIGGWSNGGQIAMSAATFQEDELSTMDNETMRTSVSTLVEAKGMEGSDHLSVDSDVRGALLLNIYSFDLNSIDSDDPAMMFIQHEESRIASMKNVLTSGTFKLGEDTYYGPIPLSERAEEVGFTMGGDLDYIKMSGQDYISTLLWLNHHEPNYAALSFNNYSRIADFFHRNLQ